MQTSEIEEVTPLQPLDNESIGLRRGAGKKDHVTEYPVEEGRWNP